MKNLKKLGLIALAALTVGCGDSTGGGTFNGCTIELDDISDLVNLDANSTYLNSSTTFTVDEITWTTSGVDSEDKGTFGRSSTKYNPGYNSFKCMQLKKGGAGYLYNTTEIKGAKTIELTWYNTYSTQESKYFPVVYEGTSQNPSTAVAANEGASLNGENTGVKDGNYDVCKYTTTYNLTESSTYFKVASGTGAVYLAKIEVK